MNAFKNTDGVNIEGLTEREALFLLSLVGNCAGGGMLALDVYRALTQFFPKYESINNQCGYVVPDNYIKFDMDVFNKIANQVLKKTNVAAPTGEVRRDANGKFLAKTWVAKFSYPDSKTGRLINRELVTQYRGKRRPNRTYDCYLEGQDLVRNGEFRRFNIDKIVGRILWRKIWLD